MLGCILSESGSG